MKYWWPRFIVRPRVRLSRPRFGMPTRPPDTVIFAVVFIAIVFILGGNIYTLIKTPPAIAGNPSGGAPLLVIPVVDQQLGLEGIVASVVVVMGSIGLGLIYYSSKYVFQPGTATRLMILGMLFAGAAFLVFTYLFALKTS
ncbi:MAG: hypothetical protein EAX81_03620 [Candidatus Thorarchaeota archaeon]|nr:hypothetical protein [Candidatus Thorarchaeota archaeon]